MTSESPVSREMTLESQSRLYSESPLSSDEDDEPNNH
jgi:hypothetical protein